MPATRASRVGHSIHENTTASLSSRRTARENVVSVPSGKSSPQHSTPRSAPDFSKTAPAAEPGRQAWGCGGVERDGTVATRTATRGVASRSDRVGTETSLAFEHRFHRMTGPLLAAFAAAATLHTPLAGAQGAVSTHLRYDRIEVDLRIAADATSTRTHRLEATALTREGTAQVGRQQIQFNRGIELCEP